MASFDLNKAARANILSLAPYRCARDDYNSGILLDANENSMGPSVALHRHLDLHRYPDPLHLDLKEKIATLRGARKEQIFLGVGSDEAIDILFRIFCNPNTAENVVVTPPTYGMYKVCAKVNDVIVKSAPLTPSFDVDMPTTLAAIDSNTKMVFLCSPGNPTSKVIPNAVVEEILSHFHHGIVIVDEAYIDFAGTPSAISLLPKYPNLVVLQTLSKAFGLAGIRVGMAFAKENIVQLMNNVKAPYNINKLTHEAALAAFEDLSQYRSNIAAILEERAFLLEKLRALSIVKKIHHTDANFILFVIPKAEEIYKTMADRGIVCRYRYSSLYQSRCTELAQGLGNQLCGLSALNRRYS